MKYNDGSGFTPGAGSAGITAGMREASGKVFGKDPNPEACKHVCALAHPHKGRHKCGICGAEYGAR